MTKAGSICRCAKRTATRRISWTDQRTSAAALNASTRGGDELLTWNSLALDGLKFDLRGGAKPRLEIAEAALSDFYSRLVITEDGRFNLRDVAALPKDAGAGDAAASATVPAASAAARTIGIRTATCAGLDEDE